MKDWVREMVNDAQGYPVASSADLYSAPPVEFLVEGLVPLFSVIGLTGFPGTGKTWLSLEMMRAVATGTPFLGKFPVKKAPVLFVGSDASLLDYAQQWRRLTHEEYIGYAEDVMKGNRDTNPLAANVHFLIQSDFNFDDMSQVARLIRTSFEVLGEPVFDVEEDEEGNPTSVITTQENFGLIVLDTLSKLTSTPENDNTARDAVFKNIRLVAEATGATLLLLHHNALPSEFRSGREFRGAGAQFGSLDCHFHLTTKAKGLVELDPTLKFRGITPKPFIFGLDVYDAGGAASLDYSEQSETKEDVHDKVIDDLIRILKQRKNANTSLTEFSIALLPAYSEKFDNVKSLKSYIRNILYTYIRRPNARIVAAVPGSRGREAFYKLVAAVEEEHDASGSTGPDLQGVPQGDEEAPGVDGE